MPSETEVKRGRNRAINRESLAPAAGLAVPMPPTIPDGPGGPQGKAPPPANTYQIGDALEYMQSFPDGALAGIATSPPYNKAFRHRGGHKSNWPNSKLMANNYAGYEDDMPPADYILWQRAFLQEALRLVGEDGVILYNIGRQIANLGENRRQAIVEGFPVRQTIIWNRGSSNNQGGKVPTIFPPIYELVYLIAGRRWRLPQRWLGEMRKWGDVWNIRFERGNPHPAPFPLELAERMVKTSDGPVMDPFAGSGTLGIAAAQLGYPYYLNDIAPDYKAAFEERLNAIKDC